MKRQNWELVIVLCCTDDEKKEFKAYARKSKIRSANRVAFNWLLSKKGRKWIRECRLIDFDFEIKKILKAKWINIPED